MQDVIGLTVYNPGSLSDEDFLRGFVARQDLAENLIDQLCNVVAGKVQTHFLVLGQRGMGKTSMLRRLALAAETDPRLSDKLIPLLFREEQYNIHSSQVFWTNCLDALGNWFERSGDRAKAAQLDKEVELLDNKYESAIALFKKWINKEARRPLLLLDNIDLIFSGLKKENNYIEEFSPTDDGMIVIGGSATSVEAICEPTGDLHEKFRIITLDKLSKIELIACLRSLALARGAEGEKVLHLLVTESARIRAMHDLTGGNPRTLTMLYLLLATDVEGDVFRDLERLLDQATVLYKARVEDLSPQARVILDAVALSWDPVLASKVAAITNLEVTVASSQLDRLHKEGIVEKVATSKTTKTAYQISERFFNIWYLMRHGARRQKNRLRWLTVFLKSFYSSDQLVERAKILASPNGATDGNSGVELGQQFLALSEAIDHEGWRSVLKAQAREEFERHAQSLGLTLDQIVDPSHVPLPSNATEWIRNGNLLRGHHNRLKEAEAAYQKSLDLDPNSFPAWFNLGALRLDDLANPVGAAVAFREALAIRPRHVPAQFLLADSLYISGEVEDAKIAYHKCLELNSKFYLAAISLGEIFSEQGDLLNASVHYQLASTLAPKDDTTALHASGYFAAYILEDFKKASTIYQKLIKIKPDDINALSNEIVIRAFIDTKSEKAQIDEEIINKHPAGGQALIRALDAASKGDHISALTFVAKIFANDKEHIFEEYKGFVLLLFRNAFRNGWSEMLVRILDEMGASEKNWPLLAGYDAYVHGANRLLDVNPEVRSTASKILSLFSGPELYKAKINEKNNTKIS